MLSHTLGGFLNGRAEAYDIYRSASPSLMCVCVFMCACAMVPYRVLSPCTRSNAFMFADNFLFTNTHTITRLNVSAQEDGGTFNKTTGVIYTWQRDTGKFE